MDCLIAKRGRTVPHPACQTKNWFQFFPSATDFLASGKSHSLFMHYPLLAVKRLSLLEFAEAHRTPEQCALKSNIT